MSHIYISFSICFEFFGAYNDAQWIHYLIDKKCYAFKGLDILRE